MKRGAAFTLDMIIAVFLFVVILLGILWLWSETYRQVYYSGDENARFRKSVDVSDILVKSGGTPANWYLNEEVTTANTHSIGLAEEENVLDRVRIDKFNASNTTILRTILGLTRETFEVTITANWTTTPNLLYNVSDFNSSSTKVHVVERIALLDGERVRLKVKVGYARR
ncbi:MAG: hypothetical protein GF416_05265 [Candidatus Altiarchaeales archaeon]|nr:hypothetical protein [Candidatus Altiarchaeales archaeon]MBD3416526.1 hypothetical protein [Candidatus Altiarchaeales archaeon]